MICIGRENTEKMREDVHDDFTVVISSTDKTKYNRKKHSHLTTDISSD